MNWLLDTTTGENQGARLRQLLTRGNILTVPGALNPLTALIARRVGFDALYFSGAAFSAITLDAPVLTGNGFR